MSSLVFHRHTLAHTHTHTHTYGQAGSHNFAFLFLCDIPPPPSACPAPRSYFSVCGGAPGQPELTLPCHAMSPVSCRFIIYALCLLFPAGHLHQAGNKLTQAVPLPQSQQLHSVYVLCIPPSCSLVLFIIAHHQHYRRTAVAFYLQHLS